LCALHKLAESYQSKTTGKDMKKIRFYLITLVLSIVMVAGSGCTTAMYTNPSPVDTSKNKYEFFIATGGFSGATEADQRAIRG
jgi:aconitase B